MMKTLELSSFLQDCRPQLIQCRDQLLRDFDYVSILGTDSKGFYSQWDGNTAVSKDSPWGERGFVCRLQKDGILWEYSFNRIPPEGGEALAEKILDHWKSQEIILRGASYKKYPPLNDFPWVEQWKAEVAMNSLEYPKEMLFQRLKSLQGKMMDQIPHVSYSSLRFQTLHISKTFISSEKDLSQSYMWSEAYQIANLKKGKVNRMLHRSYSGLKGVELLDSLSEGLKYFKEISEPYLDSKVVDPGEYPVILAPEVTGVLAHEAFGHGVEADTLTKGRALATEYMDKPVASEKVDMYDGAAEKRHTGSYLFDDEGNPAGNRRIIHQGILQGAIGDELSLKLLNEPTGGNGRRESYKRKAYSRMTNTWIAPGNDSLEDMIASIDYGYWIDQFRGGMEDPKNWGIQISCPYGREIKKAG